jgi:hypothetical protein
LVGFQARSLQHCGLIEPRETLPMAASRVKAARHNFQGAMIELKFILAKEVRPCSGASFA